MKKIIEHIEHVKGKPHHIRRRFALGAALGTSGFIALVWLTGSLATGAFAIQGADFSMSTGQNGLVVATTSVSDNSGLAGAAAGIQSSDGPARIEIVDTSSPAASKKQSEQTILPF
ncbi:MAG: hypothetical protein WAV50_00650 [Minisyncoccia bacterium]